MKHDWILGGMALLATGALASAALAERPCSPVPWEKHGFLGVVPTCYVTNYWMLEVDLDGDGAADLTRERFRAENHYDLIEGEHYAWYYQDDEIEAYYPTAGTEVYVHLTDPGGWYHWDPRVPAGQWIQPGPATPVFPYWTWMTYSADNPVFEAEGLGIVRRREDRFPCDTINCALLHTAGWMRPAEVWPYDTSDCYFGIRLFKSDGWHLGWIRLYWKAETMPPALDPVTLVSSAIHPEPGMPIRAGEPAQPTLRAQRDGEAVVVSWAAAWEGFTLERSARINPGTWTAVPGVSGNTVRLPASEAPAFLRLRKSP